MPTLVSVEGVAYIECARTPGSPRYKEFKVHKEMALLVTVALNALMALKVTEWMLPVVVLDDSWSSNGSNGFMYGRMILWSSDPKKEESPSDC